MRASVEGGMHLCFGQPQCSGQLFPTRLLASAGHRGTLEVFVTHTVSVTGLSQMLESVGGCNFSQELLAGIEQDAKRIILRARPGIQVPP